MARTCLAGWASLGFLLVFVATGLRADVKLPSIFSDNMVLQQGVRLPVRGTADPGETVTVELLGQRLQATASAAGRWEVTLEPLAPASAPAEMRITGKTALTIRNALVGDVWLASGQSNMQVSLREADSAAAEIAAADFPEIRFYVVRHDIAASPREDTGGEWKVCTPTNAPAFSAVGYFFARELHQRHRLPTAVISTAVGSSACEAWVPVEVLKANPSFPQPAALDPATYPDWPTYDAFRKGLYERYSHKDAGVKEECRGWAEPGLDTADWREVRVPGSFETQGMRIDGAVWFRKEVDIPENWRGGDLLLYLGPITDDDVAFFNGVQIGKTENAGREWVFRTYRVPAERVQAGRSVVAIRIFNAIGSGGFCPTYPAPLALHRPNDKENGIVLSGPWKCKVETALEPAEMPFTPPRGHHVPAALFNAMIAPFTGVPVRGFIWYQGESNAGQAVQHDTLFPAMITSWRQLWGRADLPFYFVQLANYQARTNRPSEEGWARMRESQQKALAVPHTGMAVTIDIGDATNVHPRNKQDVGKRLALWARRDCYGEKELEVSGPLYLSNAVEKDRIRVRFTHVGGGLVAKGEELKGFAVAGADKVFVWAKAAIEGETVVVANEAVSAPRFVRYAWANNPECNLYNGAGLPAAPFRTDD